MEETTAVPVFDVKEEPVIGLARSYDRLVAESVPEDKILRSLRDEVSRQDLPIPGARSGGDVFSWLVNWFKSRELVDDLGSHPGQVEWLALHVPPGGSAEFSIENKQVAASGCTLKIVGLGGGSGKKVSFSTKYKSPARKHCARFIQHFDLHARLFQVKNGSKTTYEVVADVTEIRQQEVLPWKDCPYCGVAAAAIDRFQYEIDPQGVDLRKDDVGQIRSESVDLENNRSFELGVPIQVPLIGKPLDAGISVKRDESWRCEVAWTFPPGKFTVAYRESEGLDDLPYWGFQ